MDNWTSILQKTNTWSKMKTNPALEEAILFTIYMKIIIYIYYQYYNIAPYFIKFSCYFVIRQQH